MTKEWLKEVPNWEQDYLKLAGNNINAQQMELLKGYRDIKAHEGMMYGRMYVEWKRMKGYE